MIPNLLKVSKHISQRIHDTTAGARAPRTRYIHTVMRRLLITTLINLRTRVPRRTVARVCPALCCNNTNHVHPNFWCPGIVLSKSIGVCFGKISLRTF